jgi:hypothetical protein
MLAEKSDRMSNQTRHLQLKLPPILPNVTNRRHRRRHFLLPPPPKFGLLTLTFIQRIRVERFPHLARIQ